MTNAQNGTIRYQVGGFSEQGPRPENQDALLTDAFDELGLVALADGMGGEKGGRLAADTALAALVKGGRIASVDAARRAVRDADLAVRRMAEESPDEHGGMGCALGLLSLTNGSDGAGWIAAHVGDVRILSRSPDGVLRLETRDHTPAFARWEAGEITLDEIPDSSGANRLQRAVGRGGEADAVWMPAAPGWSWLIISDGVYKAMRIDELSRAMTAPTVDDVCRAIQERVHTRGPDDNYTAVVVRAMGKRATAIDPETTQPMTRTETQATSTTKRSGTSGAALAVAILALLLSGFAAWSGLRNNGVNVQRTEVDALRAEVDSLRAMLTVQSDPFGPAVPETIPQPGAATPDTSVLP